MFTMNTTNKKTIIQRDIAIITRNRLKRNRLNTTVGGYAENLPCDENIYVFNKIQYSISGSRNIQSKITLFPLHHVTMIYYFTNRNIIAARSCHFEFLDNVASVFLNFFLFRYLFFCTLTVRT